MDLSMERKKRDSFFRRLSLQSCVKRTPDHQKESSYERSISTRRQDSAPVTPVKSRGLQLTPSRIKNFFAKHSLCSNALKRTKSVIKLRTKSNDNFFAETPCITRNGSKLRKSRSHESILSEKNTPEFDLGVQVKSIHSSILGRENCFQVTTSPSKTYARPGKTTYFACRSAKERDEWVEILSLIVRPDLHTKRRTENSLQMWILEAKGIPNKKKYFCELFLDNTLYARTACKLKDDICFWADTYKFDGLPEVHNIHIILYREADVKKRKKDKNKIIGKVTIVTNGNRDMTEEWYPVIPLISPSILAKFCSKDLPSIRVKHRFQSFDILPLTQYQNLLNVLVRGYLPLCEILEPMLGIQAKADFANALVHIMHSIGRAKEFLADLVMLDINSVDHETLIFRGNTLATKAMENYMHHVGDIYLHFTLTPFILTLAATQQELEVDPLKVNNDIDLMKHQRNLRAAVELAWSRIQATQDRFPIELREVFSTVHQRLVKARREDLSDNISSASIFLRFLVPAILSPSLFGITNEYPNERTARNLTLVAKSIQTLANFIKFQSKEDCMEFLNDFMEREAKTMKTFLRKISMPTTSPKKKRSGEIDLGKHLSTLHILLAEHLPKISTSGPHGKLIVQLNSIIQELNVALDVPNVIYEHQEHEHNPISNTQLINCIPGPSLSGLY